METLQHLLFDPTYGYLYPHRHAIAAFGLPNEYQLNKYRPHLTEGQHYLKLRGSDHIDRIYYTPSGLVLLARLIATPQAAQFAQDVIRQIPAGEIVPSPPTPLAPTPVHPTAFYPTPDPFPSSDPLSLVPLTPADPAFAFASPPTSRFPPLIERSQGHPPSGALSPQETAALIFQAQQMTADHLLAAQQIASPNPPPTEVRVTVNLWQRWDDWLNAQEASTAILLTLLICSFLAFGSYLMVGSLYRPSPPPQPQTLPPQP